MIRWNLDQTNRNMLKTNRNIPIPFQPKSGQRSALNTAIFLPSLKNGEVEKADSPPHIIRAHLIELSRP